MSGVKELENILQECKKTKNYDKFIEHKKEFIDSEIIFRWPYSWDDILVDIKTYKNV